MMSKKSNTSTTETPLSLEEQKAKIQEVRNFLGPLHQTLPTLRSDDSILRYLRARNWNPKRATKMMKDTLKWRLDYKPENIQWENIAKEAETGKVYRANYVDKHGRTVLVLRPGYQNSTSAKGQIRYLVYCMENAIFNLGADQEQMVWLINFECWSTSSVSVKVTRETARILQDYYPERLGMAILYNPPKIFESFWKVVKPFLEPKTHRKVQFVYSENVESQKIMEELFDMDKLESAFGGRCSIGFDYKVYARKMMSDDERRMSTSLISECSALSLQQSVEPTLLRSDSEASEPISDASDEPSSHGSPTSPKSGIVYDSSKKSMQQKLGCMEGAKVIIADASEAVQLSEPPKNLQARC